MTLAQISDQIAQALNQSSSENYNHAASQPSIPQTANPIP
jgi:hypothetical protein